MLQAVGDAQEWTSAKAQEAKKSGSQAYNKAAKDASSYADEAAATGKDYANEAAAQGKGYAADASKSAGGVWQKVISLLAHSHLICFPAILFRTLASHQLLQILQLNSF